MDYRKALNNEIFELMMKRALIERYTDEVTVLRKEDDDISFSAAFEKKVSGFARLAGRNERIKGLVKISAKAAVTAAAIMGIIFGGLLTQPKIYADVLEVIRSVFPTHDSYEYPTVNSVESPDFDKNIKLQYIPDGYTLRYIYYADYAVAMWFDDIDENELHFDYGLAQGSKISIDNEHTELFEFEHNGIKYYYYKAIEQDEFNTMLWYKNGYYFKLKAQLSKEEFVKIAESIGNAQ